MEEVTPLRAALLVIWAGLTLFVTTVLGFLVGVLFNYQDVWSFGNYVLTTGSLLAFALFTMVITSVLYSLEKYLDSLD